MNQEPVASAADSGRVPINAERDPGGCPVCQSVDRDVTEIYTDPVGGVQWRCFCRRCGTSYTTMDQHSLAYQHAGKGSGVRETPKTAERDPNGIDQHSPGSKLDAYKTKPDLVLGGFSRALNAVAQIGTYGAIKYTPNGWRVVPDGIQRYSDAMIRHYLAEKAGKDGIEEKDPGSNFLHAAHLAWNALARLELILQEMEG